MRNRADVFDAGIMAQLQYSLVQMAQRSKTVSLNVMDSRQFLHITFQPKVSVIFERCLIRVGVYNYEETTI